MNNEYVIINKTAIEKRIEEWEADLQECYKAPIGKFNNDSVIELQQAIVTAREILSQSTPLIPEIEKAFDAGTRVPYDKSKPLNKWWVNVDQRQEKFISNLKLDI